MEEYAGTQFVGIDLHRRRAVIVRTDDTGQALELPGLMALGWDRLR